MRITIIAADPKSFARLWFYARGDRVRGTRDNNVHNTSALYGFSRNHGREGSGAINIFIFSDRLTENRMVGREQLYEGTTTAFRRRSHSDRLVFYLSPSLLHELTTTFFERNALVFFRNKSAIHVVITQ